MADLCGVYTRVVVSENHRPVDLRARKGGGGSCVAGRELRTLTITNLLEYCILLKSSRGRSIAPAEDIWAKYLGAFFRQPVGGTRIGRGQGWAWPGHSEWGLAVFSKASFTSSSLELPLLLLPAGRMVLVWHTREDCNQEGGP